MRAIAGLANLKYPSNPAMQKASSDRSRSCTTASLTSWPVRPTLPSVTGPYPVRKGAVASSLLASRGTGAVSSTGCWTSGCVRATAMDAVCYQDPLSVPQESIADRAPVPHHANLFDIQATFGDGASVAEVLDYLSKGRVEEAAE